MTRYIHKDLYLDMENSSRARFYKDGKLMFVGNAYIALHMFIKESDNDPEVIKRFQAQLEQREKPKFSKLEKEAHPKQGPSD